MALGYVAQFVNATGNVDPAFTPTLIQRVQMSMVAQCIVVYNEVSTTPSHTARAAFASKVMQAPASFAPQFAQLVISQAASLPLTDAQIDSSVLAVWNLMAGV